MRMTVVLAAVLLVGLVGCSTGDDGSAERSETSHGSATVIRTIEPVDAGGVPLPGYTARDIPTLAPLDCFTDITGGLRCSDTPDGLRFCVEAGESTAACLADPRDTEFGLVGATLTFMTDVSPYVPAGLDLADGSRCTLSRNPMAMATGDAQFVHVYGCTDGPTQGVYVEPLAEIGNPVRNVIDRTSDRWTVQGGDDTGPTRTVEVAVAYELFSR
ncbi:MAG: hypothetical protein C0482_24140 [Gordonia sp.]|nr:hypothetical protein [Gordonia sp. (in: high G+C Gram-positive bacteria)]